MAATGQPFTLARHAFDNGGVSYTRSAWHTSGWARLLPVQAMPLELVIGTATVLDIAGDLGKLVDQHPASTDLPDGVSTRLTWYDPDEDDTRTISLRRRAESAFVTSITNLERPIPDTVSGLAELLAELGVYTHTETAHEGDQWRAPHPLVDMTTVVPIPDEWREHEDRVRWSAHTSSPAHALLASLSDALELESILTDASSRTIASASIPPRTVDTTLQRLAAAANMPVHAVRDGIDGLMYRYGVEALRNSEHLSRLDISSLADHARLQLVVEVSNLLNHSSDEADDDAGVGHGWGDGWGGGVGELGGGVPAANIRWAGSPWRTFDAISSDTELSDGAREVTAYMQFTVRKPEGGTTETCLAEMAAAQGCSTLTAARTLIKLEEANLLRWDADRQRAELAGSPDQFLRR